MHSLRLYGLYFTHRIVMIATVPIIGLKYRSNSKCNDNTYDNQNTLGSSIELKKLLPLRSAHLNETNKSKMFTNEWFKPFVSIRAHFTKTSDDNDCNVTPNELCSGIIVTETGLVVTVAHKIASYTKVNIKLFDGRDVLGQVVCSASPHGLAIIQLVDDSGAVGHWPVVSYNINSDSYALGTDIYAIGNESYNRNHRVVKGLICGKPVKGLNSILNRTIEYIPHSAAIGSRETGCPVVNTSGEVLGITCLSVNSNLSYTLTYFYILNLVNKIQSDLSKPKAPTTPWSYGLVAHWMDSENVSQFTDCAQLEGKNLPPNVTNGLIVLGYDKCQLAFKENIDKYDVIIEINGQKLSHKTDTFRALAYEDNTASDSVMKVVVVKANGDRHRFTLRKAQVKRSIT